MAEVVRAHIFFKRDNAKPILQATVTGNLRTALSSKEATQEFMEAAAAIKEPIPYGYQG
jgi:hypothetical protein